MIEYKLKKGNILKDGHTMFLQDVVKDLNRKVYLEDLKSKTESGANVPLDRLFSLLRLIDEEYGLIDSWISNGCEHGYKPAKDCPNQNCNAANMQSLWDSLIKG